MKKYIIFASLIAISNTLLSQVDSWVTTAKGCKVYVQGYVSGDSVSWSGTCKTYIGEYAEGYGTRKVFRRFYPSPFGGYEMAVHSEYTGKLIMGKREGKGTNAWDDGRKFVGEFVDNQPWVGKMYKNGSIYEYWDIGKAIPSSELGYSCGNNYLSDEYAIISVNKNGKQCGIFVEWVTRNLSNLPVNSEANICGRWGRIPSGWVKISESSCEDCNGFYQYKIKKISSTQNGSSGGLVTDSRVCSICNGKGFTTTSIKVIKYYEVCYRGGREDRCPVYGYEDQTNKCAPCKGTGKY